MKIISKCKRFIMWIFKALIALTLIGAISVFIIFQFFSDELPDHSSLRKYTPNVSSRVFLQDGSKLCEYSYETRYFIPVERIPAKLINAFIAAEDKHFYDHIGIDIIGILRSVIKNLEHFKSGKRPQGASTITQQVARIFLIKNSEVSYIRKIKEIILSLRIEATLSKKRILELYLNQIYLGQGTYGVAAAAKIYFNKTLDEMTIAECSYLAALAKGANNYHPINNIRKAVMRRNWVINRQFEDGYITQEESEKASEEDLVVKLQPQGMIKAEYFSEEVRKYLLEKFPIESLNKEGFIVRATLDANMQQCAYNALRKGLENIDRRFGWRGPICNINVNQPIKEIVASIKSVKHPLGGENFEKAVVISKNHQHTSIVTEKGEFGKVDETDIKWTKDKIKLGDVVLVYTAGENRFAIKQVPLVQGAIIVIEVNSGRILAMQGGYSFYQSEFNRATQAIRQIGSAFKPFVYLAGLENGFAPNTIIDAEAVEIDLGESFGIWKPKNYNDVEIDKITFRRALERSVNTATVRIAQEVGMEKIAQLAEKFHIFDKMPEYLAYALGAGDSTLLRITAAYAMLANGGKRITPTMIDYILNRRGNILYKNDTRVVDNQTTFDAEFPPKLNDMREQILDERSIYQTTFLLEGVMQRIVRWSDKFGNFPVAGKTGTSNDSRDTWFIGYTPDIAVGVFVGFDDQSKNLGKNAIGLNIALPIFLDFMTEAKKMLLPKPFKIPKGIKLRKIDLESGEETSDDPKNLITEAFKEDDQFPTKINGTKKHRSISELIDNLDQINHEIPEEEEIQKIKPILGIY